MLVDTLKKKTTDPRGWGFRLLGELGWRSPKARSWVQRRNTSSRASSITTKGVWRWNPPHFKCAKKPVLCGGSTENKYQRDRTEKETGRLLVLPGWDCRWDYPFEVARRLHWKLWACGSLYFTNYITLVLPSFPLAPEWVPFLPTSTLGLRKRESYTVPNPKRSPRPTSRVFLLRSTCFKDGPVCILQSPPHSRRYSTDASFSSLKIAGERFTSHRNVNFNKEIARGHTSPLHHYHHKHTQQQFTNTCDPQVSSP